MDKNCGYQEERRNYCGLIIALKQKFEDDKKINDEWKIEIDKKLTLVCAFINDIRGPYLAGLWAFRIFIGALIAGFVALLGWIIKLKIKFE